MTTSQNVRILLVEDDSSIGYMIKAGMQTLDTSYHLDHAYSAEEGLELWDEQPYDLVMTDFNLRGMNGLSLVVQLRQRGSTVPTVLFTAYDTPRLRQQASEADVSVFLSKPFLLDDFVDTARSLLPLEERAIGKP